MNNVKQIDKYCIDLTRSLGEGAMGFLYFGYELQKPENIYVINQIPRAWIEKNPKLNAHFQKNMEVLKSLKHPNIVRCFDVITTVNNYYLVLEFCSGGTMRNFLDKRGTIPDQEARKILIQLLSGYRELLNSRLIYRDLKPESIWIHEGLFKFSDFLFSKLIENYDNGMRMETFVANRDSMMYISPEIFRGRKYTEKCDVWSMAVIYYEMLFGKDNWEKYNGLENMVLNKTVIFPPKAEVKEESKAFLLKALNLEESERMSWDELFSRFLNDPIPNEICPNPKLKLNHAQTLNFDDKIPQIASIIF